MMMLRYFAAALALISSPGLPSCDLFRSEEVTLCQEAMKMDADQLKLGEVARNRLVSVTTCNRNTANLQSAQFSTGISCN
jgi:hypothetical protein